MRADVPLLASLLAASAAAQHNATSNSTTSIANSYGNQKTVTELEAQVEALRKQLESAKQETCDAPSNPVTGGSASGSSSGSGSGSSGNQGSPAAPAESKPAGYSGEGASGNEASPAGSQAPSYDNSGKDSSAEGSDKPAAPATTEAPQSYPGAGSDNQGSNQGSSNQDSQQKAKSEGNYYAPMAPSSGAKSTSTVTIIVSADKTETRTVHQTQTLTNTVSGSAETGSADNSDVEIVTATETYCGKGPIPTAPGSGSGSESGAESGSGSGSNKGSGSNASSALSSVISKASKASSDLSSVISSTRGYFGNGTVPYPTGASSGLLTTTRGAESLTTSNSVPAASGSIPAASNNATTHAFQTGTAASTATSSSASASATAKLSDCETFCQTLTNFNGYEVTPETCVQRTAGEQVDSASGQSSVGCAASFTPEVDLCQVTLNVKTSGTAETYMEVWLPNANETSWNGRSMNTDNGGLNGCVHYVDMQYVTGLGFAAIGDNAGHNGSSFDGTWTLNNNEAIIDWSYRARHAAVEIGKETISEFYSKKADYSYYVGCSAGGAQGIQSAEKYPNDFDGIIAGAAANDFNHLQGWSASFRQMTGSTGNDTFLTQADWITVQSYILDQCDQAIDGVADGILEDPTQCKFNVSAIPVCGSDSDSDCLTATQIQTVEDVFKPLYGEDGKLIYPALFPGSQVDAFKLGLLSGNIQGIAQDFFRGAVFNDSSFDIATLTKQDIARAQELDDLHGNPSAFSAQLGDFNAAGKKLMVYHGMADPMTSGGNAQRYYLKAAKELGMSNTELDDFYRLFRISGMAHCGVGGISGAGAWMFGQNGAASSASNNIVSNLVDWVENNNAPETLLGTKFWYDTPSSGIMFERAHCRFPYRTVYQGGEDGDSTKPESWGCEMIENWQDCAGEFCSEDGSF